MVTVKPLVLASASPRRADLLRQAGFSFEIHPSRIVSEELIAPVPRGIELLALEKARMVAGKYSEGIILGADTLVLCKGKILGKPGSREEARETLRFLSGQEHMVVTGIAVVDAGGGQKEITDHAETRVWMQPLSNGEISDYVGSGEPMDKAGSYGIQGLGSVFIERIEGCYFNVVGLSLNRVYLLLSRFGINPCRNGRSGNNG